MGWQRPKDRANPPGQQHGHAAKRYSEVPGLAAGAALDAGIVLRPLANRPGRTVRIAWRAQFPRRAAVEAVGEVIAARLKSFAEAAAAETV